MPRISSDGALFTTIAAESVAKQQRTASYAMQDLSRYGAASRQSRQSIPFSSSSSSRISSSSVSDGELTFPSRPTPARVPMPRISSDGALFTTIAAESVARPWTPPHQVVHATQAYNRKLEATKSASRALSSSSSSLPISSDGALYSLAEEKLGSTHPLVSTRSQAYNRGASSNSTTPWRDSDPELASPSSPVSTSMPLSSDGAVNAFTVEDMASSWPPPHSQAYGWTPNPNKSYVPPPTDDGDGELAAPSQPAPAARVGSMPRSSSDGDLLGRYGAAHTPRLRLSSIPFSDTDSDLGSNSDAGDDELHSPIKATPTRAAMPRVSSDGALCLRAAEKSSAAKQQPKVSYAVMDLARFSQTSTSTRVYPHSRQPTIPQYANDKATAAADKVARSSSEQVAPRYYSPHVSIPRSSSDGDFFMHPEETAARSTLLLSAAGARSQVTTLSSLASCDSHRPPGSRVRSWR
jgi:hypothetical protein